MRSRGQCHVKPIVDDNPCGRAANGGNTRAHKMIQRPAVEVTLTNLHKVHAFTCGCCHPLDEGLFP